MKELKLGGKLGMVALIDDEDFERVSAMPWSPNRSDNPDGSLSTYYVQGRKGVMLHRFILGLKPGDPHVDHINRNGLDNQKSNLRLCSQSQNHANRPKAKRNTSGFKGVYSARGGRWFSLISLNNKNRSLGTFDSKEEAASAYDKAALEQWGEFAFLNFPVQK